METKCVIGQHALRKDEFVVIRKTTITKNLCQYATLPNFMFLFNLKLLARQMLLICIFLSLICPLTVSGQPVQLPPDNFQCGPDYLNQTCERWGYDTCISDNGEFYCLPCSHEYLSTLCGTQEEMKGCNLYCTEKALDKQADKITTNFIKQLTYLNRQKDKFDEEAEFRKKRTKALERSLRNKTIALRVIIAALGVAVLVLIGFIIWCIRQRHSKTNQDEEKPVPEPSLPLLAKDENTDGGSQFSEETLPKEPSVSPDSIEELNVSDKDEQHTITQEADISNNYKENECPAKTKLSSIPATNTKGNDKLAIKKTDLSHSCAPSQ